MHVSNCFQFSRLGASPHFGLEEPSVAAWPRSPTWQVSQSSQSPRYAGAAHTAASLSIYSSPALVLNSCRLYYCAFISQTVTVHMYVGSISFSSQAKTKLSLSATASVKMEITKQKRRLDFALLKLSNKSCGAGCGLGHAEAAQSLCCAT